VTSRIWHGWTSTLNADAYEHLLREEVFVEIKGSAIPGFIDIQMLRRPDNGEVELVTIMRFENIEGIKRFAGEDYEACVVPQAARRLLSRFDERSQHDDIRIAER
jgi:antibiotic biosynthesis monooxygenase (ABM) superfamily enzyme